MTWEEDKLMREWYKDIMASLGAHPKLTVALILILTLSLLLGLGYVDEKSFTEIIITIIKLFIII